MKRPLIGLALALVASTPIAGHAQGFGIKAGFSYGDVSNDGAFPGTVNRRNGFAVGIGGNTGGPVGLGIEGLYAQRGVSSSTPGDSREFDYIDVPLYLRVALPNPVVSPFAYAGPQMSFLLQCDAQPGNCPSGDRPQTSYSAIIGAGLRFGGLAGLSIEGRYVYGLSDFNYSTVTTSSNYKTRSFLLLFGLGM